MLQTLLEGKKTMGRQTKVADDLIKDAMWTLIDIMFILGIQAVLVLAAAKVIPEIEKYEGIIIICSNFLIVLVAQFMSRKKHKKHDKVATDENNSEASCPNCDKNGYILDDEQ